MHNHNWNIGWGLTSFCNSKCKHCYNCSSNDNLEHLSFDQAKSIVDKLSKNGVKSINYGTGESGLVVYFWDLVEYVARKNIIQGLTSNGSSVTEKTIKYVKEYMNDIDISIDYPDEFRNNEFRGSKHAWEWAVNACNLLKQNNINFSIVTCMHSKNSDYRTIDNFLRFAKKYDCDWRINWFKPTGRGKINKEFKLDPIKVHNIFKYIVEKSIIIALPDPYFSSITGINSRIASPCGSDSFRITPDSLVVPCVYFTKEFKGISILDNDFKNVIVSDSMQKVRQRDIPFCKRCEFYKTCGGGCVSRAFLEYGSINAPDAFCFKKTHLTSNPLVNLKYIYKPSKTKVHENYLCTLIVHPR